MIGTEFDFNSQRLYPVGWGWNSGGRAGNITADEIRQPRQVQKSPPHGENFVNCAAGTHHSLLVSDAGQVYALGEGRRGQLGLANQFTGPLTKGGIYQCLPRQSTPSGAYKYQADIKIIQVACGDTFSVAREVSVDEAVNMVIGFAELEKSLSFLMSRYPESLPVQHAWALVRQERYRINKKSEGQVLVWGSGKHGELGLGVLGRESPYPQRILKFRDCCITHIAAGARHVLAVDLRGRLFSWGCGRGGRLGHGDFEDRESPELVTFFASLYIEHCSAGDAHSAVITIMRSGARDKQLRRISTFGRGAHGRLGNGTNKNMCTPVLVSQWLPSLDGVQFFQVACGGAHTLALGYKSVPQSIANPRGKETFICSWGYGMNGQLGTGYRFDSFVPVLARMPRWDIIAEVSAGRSWSVARSSGGDVYTWGKGLRGQLGQGDLKFSVAPRKVECLSSFVRISSGYAHNMCLTVQKKFLNMGLTETKAREQGVTYDAFEPLVSTMLKKTISTSLNKFNCCRRLDVNSGQQSSQKYERYDCLDCNITCICISCAKVCHRGHRIFNHSVTAYMKEIRAAAIIARQGVTNSSQLPAAAKQKSRPGVSNRSKGRANANAAVRDLNDDARIIPYSTSVLQLENLRILRPDRSHLEVLPRISILDNHREVLMEPLSALSAAASPKLPKHQHRRQKFKEVPRRSRESNREREVNKRYIQVDRALHVPRTLDGSDAVGDQTAEGAKKETPVPQCCRCGLFNQCCRIEPTVPEHPDENVLVEGETALSVEQDTKVESAAEPTNKQAPKPPVRVDGVPVGANHIAISTVTRRRKKRRVIPDEDRDAESIRLHYLRRDLGVRNIAARRVQRVGRAYVERRHARVAHLEYLILRREVCTHYWHEKVMSPIFGKVEHEYKNYRIEQELQAMRREEAMTQKYNYYIQLQKGLIGIKAISYGTRRLVGQMTPLLPRYTFQGKPTSEWRPTFAFTHTSIRSQQLHLHHQRRVPIDLLAHATRELPRSQVPGWEEGRVPDTDMMLFTQRYLRYVDIENWRRKVIAAAEWKEELRKKAAAAALARLKAKQNAMKNIMAEAEAIALRNAHRVAMGAGPAPPAGPPPRSVVVAAAQQARAAKQQQLENKSKKLEKLEDAEFSITEEGFEVQWRRRRHSITDPSGLYNRMGKLGTSLAQSNRAKRRNSLPVRITSLYMHQQPTPLETIEHVNESLSMYSMRFNAIKNLQHTLDQAQVESDFVDSKPKEFYIRMVAELLRKSILSPRLPLEMRNILRNGGRRRTIGEPQRLSRQLNLMMDHREAFGSLIENIDDNYSFKRRRRSFDHGEVVDRAQGLEATIGIDYEIWGRQSTVTGLLKDSVEMERMMVRAKFMEPTEKTANLTQDMSVAEMSKRFSMQQGSAPKTTEAGSSQKRGKAGRRMSLGAKKQMLDANTWANSTSEPAAGVDELAMVPEEGEEGYDYDAEAADYANDDGTSSLNAYDSSYSYDYDSGSAEYDHSQLSQLQEWDAAVGSDGGESGTVVEWGGVSVWQEHYTEEGKAYYYNVSSGDSSWEMPAGANVQIETQNQDEEGNWYWFNGVTGESTWI